jgi:hypothetical protein
MRQPLMHGFPLIYLGRGWGFNVGLGFVRGFVEGGKGLNRGVWELLGSRPRRGR